MVAKKTSVLFCLQTVRRDLLFSKRILPKHVSLEIISNQLSVNVWHAKRERCRQAQDSHNSLVRALWVKFHMQIVTLILISKWKYPSKSSLPLLVSLAAVISLTKGELMVKKKKRERKLRQYYLTLVFSNESKPAKANLNFSWTYSTSASLCFANVLFNFWSVRRIHGKAQGSFSFCAAADTKQM